MLDCSSLLFCWSGCFGFFIGYGRVHPHSRTVVRCSFRLRPKAQPSRRKWVSTSEVSPTNKTMEVTWSTEECRFEAVVCCGETSASLRSCSGTRSCWLEIGDRTAQEDRRDMFLRLIHVDEAVFVVPCKLTSVIRHPLYMWKSVNWPNLCKDPFQPKRFLRWVLSWEDAWLFEFAFLLIRLFRILHVVWGCFHDYMPLQLFNALFRLSVVVGWCLLFRLFRLCQIVLCCFILCRLCEIVLAC